MPELRRLRYFLAVAAERNFTRAAQRLHVAQPALSRQVALLERELGVQLLRRTTHDVELTEAGEMLLARGPAVVGAVDDLWRDARAFAAGEQGSVTLGYSTSAGYETAPRLVALVAERAPGLHIATRVLWTVEILDGVRDGSLDAGLVRCPPERADGIESRPLRLERQGVLLRDDDALAAGPAVALAQLRERALLLHPRDANPGHYDAIVGLCRDAGFEPRILLRDLVIDLAYTSIAGGRSVAIVGESSCAGLPAGLAWRPLSPPAALETRLVVRALNRGPAAARLIDLAGEVAGQLGWLRQH